MTQTPQAKIDPIDRIVQVAIASYLGDITHLPSAVRSKIIDVYRKFFEAYLNIGRNKGISSQSVVDQIMDLDQDLLAYMQHFFSDYQVIYSSFVNLNRLARELLQIDRATHPKKFEEQVDALMAGRKQFTDELIFSELHLNRETDEQHGQDQ